MKAAAALDFRRPRQYRAPTALTGKPRLRRIGEDHRANNRRQAVGADNEIISAVLAIPQNNIDMARVLSQRLDGRAEADWHAGSDDGIAKDPVKHGPQDPSPVGNVGTILTLGARRVEQVAVAVAHLAGVVAMPLSFDLVEHAHGRKRAQGCAIERNPGANDAQLRLDLDNIDD